MEKADYFTGPAGPFTLYKNMQINCNNYISEYPCGTIYIDNTRFNTQNNHWDKLKLIFKYN